MNLIELCPTITIPALKQALIDAFESVYGLKSTPGVLTEADRRRVAELREHYASWDWRFGQKLPFTFRCEGRFAWGGVELQLLVNEGILLSVAVYSDDMDFAFPPALEKALTGCPFSLNALSARLEGVPHGMDVFSLLQQQEI